MEKIPALDLIDGCAVRLRQGDFAQKTIYSNDPLALAQRLEDAGITRLHMVDLDGAKTSAPKHLKLLEKVATKTALQIDFGGGLRQTQQIKDVLNAGATWATVGSIAVMEPNLFSEWLEAFSPATFFLGADVREEKLAVKGWQEQTEVPLMEFLEKWHKRGVNHIFVTDIARDGLLQGPATDLYAKIKSLLPDLLLVASGGVSSANDFPALEAAGCAGVIVGKAFFEGKIPLSELSSQR